MNTRGPLPAHSSEFEQKYAGTASVNGMGLKLDFLPWDIREPQPMLVALEAVGGFGRRVLDAGCGRGENSIHLALRGHQVTAFDSSPTAVEQARERARARGAGAAFMVADVTGLDALKPGFDTILDWGLYHCLPEQVRRPYVDSLSRLVGPGATWHLFCFSESTPASMPMNWLRVSHDGLRANLDGRWRIAGIEETTTTTTLNREILERQRKSAEEHGAGFGADTLDTDERGRILMPISHLRLERVLADER